MYYWLVVVAATCMDVYLAPEQADARRKRRRTDSQVFASADSGGGTPPVTRWTERNLGDRQAAVRAYESGMKVRISHCHTIDLR